MPAPKPLTGRKCYDHLGGKLGAMLFERMMEEQWIQLAEGRSTVYELTETGREKLRELGIDPDERRLGA